MNKQYILTFLCAILIVFAAQSQTNSFLKESNTDVTSMQQAANGDESRVTNKIRGHAYLEGYPGESYEGLDLEISGSGYYEVVEINTFGSFSVSVPDNWSGTITPILCDNSGVTIDPPFFEYTNVYDTTIRDQDFYATVSELYTISGIITDSITGEPIANKEIRFEVETADGGRPTSITVDTDDNGQYEIVQLPCWSVKINPGLEYHYITPFTREYTEWDQNYANQNYTAYNFEFPVPEGWEYKTSADAHIIALEYTSNPNVCGVPLEIGDLIGLFYLDDNDEFKCGGFARWHDEYNVALIGYRDDDFTTEKDGFVTGEEMNWFVYRYDEPNSFYPTKAEYIVQLGYSYNNKWSKGALSIVEEVNSFYKNSIVIPAGWSGFSSYTEISVWPPFIASIMEPIADELVILQSMDKMYYPGAGINTMFLWTNSVGYKIKVTEDATMPMPGCLPADLSVSLTSTWNLLPVLSPANVWLSDVFDGVIDEVIVIKEISGNRIFWPAMGIQTLQVLEPGKAYYTAVSQNVSVSYENSKATKDNPIVELNNFVNKTPWNTPIETGFTHSIAIRASALSALEIGDFIGAFNEDGLCVGLSQINDLNQNIAITAYGNDMSTSEADGFFEGENMHFKIFKTTSGEVINAGVEYSGNYTSADGLFTDNGMSVIDNLKLSSTGIVSLSSKVKMYPNPTTGRVNIQIGDDLQYLVSLKTISGQVVIEKTLSGSSAIDISGLNKGVYFVEISGDNSKMIQKLIVN